MIQSTVIKLVAIGGGGGGRGILPLFRALIACGARCSNLSTNWSNSHESKSSI